MSKDHFRDILKSTSLIGGSSLINILIGMVRTKFVAVLLGPAGVGLIGVYATIIDLASLFAGMGINKSGVRQIAEAVGTGDDLRVARTVKAVRRSVWITGALGAIGLALSCRWVSFATFKDEGYWLGIALLGVTVLMGNISVGQSCVLQGTRRIAELAKVSVIGSFNGLIIAVPFYWLWGQGGIIPSLIMASVAGLLTSWWFARRVPIRSIPDTWRDSRGEAGKLLRLGVPMMAAGLAGSCPQYFIRAFLIREIGIAGVGIWQAAFNLSGMLAKFVLGAMATDYYPRLTAIAHDHEKVRAEINAQTEISLLLAAPGLAATIVFAPLAIAIFYSSRFDAAIDILRWSVYGVFGQVISWPMGVTIAAFGRGRLLFLAEAIAAGVYIGLMWVCVKVWGMVGTGIAFLLLYVFHVFFMFAVSRALCRMRWTFANCLLIIGFSVALAVLGCVGKVISEPLIHWSVSLAILLGIVSYCLWRLSRRSGINLDYIRRKLRFSR